MIWKKFYNLENLNTKIFRNFLKIMQTKKINLKEFKKESLQIKKLLEAKGGSGCATMNCVTRGCSYKSDNKPCDAIY